MHSNARDPRPRQGRRLLSWPSVQEQCGGLSRAEVWRLRKSGRFPAPIKLGSRRLAWVAEEIDAWVQEQIDRSA